MLKSNKNLLPYERYSFFKYKIIISEDKPYIVTEGYLISFEEENSESCNCKKAKKNLKNGDVHMYVGLKKNALKKDCIVVEITPTFKKKYPDYETLLEENSKIRFTAFLLYDFLMKRMLSVHVNHVAEFGVEPAGRFIQ